MNVFGLTGDDMTIAKEVIDKLKEFFFDILKLPKSLKEAGYETDKQGFKEWR